MGTYADTPRETEGNSISSGRRRSVGVISRKRSLLRDAPPREPRDKMMGERAFFAGAGQRRAWKASSDPPGNLVPRSVRRRRIIDAPVVSFMISNAHVLTSSTVLRVRSAIHARNAVANNLRVGNALLATNAAANDLRRAT